MKLWRLDYHHDDTPSGTASEWFTSKREASVRAAQLRRDYLIGIDGFFIYEGSPSAVEVPTKRTALAAWLNKNAFAQ